ncbi:MAG: alpha/beta fold hydrolase [Bryobacteraceae bacterium]
MLTIAGNFWPRQIDQGRYPEIRRSYEIDSSTRIVVFEHQPLGTPRGQLVFVHGLEGSADAGYIKSFAQTALTRGFGVHRMNLRTCGGTEELCQTMYHSGLTGDTRFILEQIHERNIGPIFLVGFSLGGNVTLKLAGELGETKLLAGACAVSTPIDLAACVRQLDRPSNRVYAWRFLDRLKERVRRKSRLSPDVYPLDRLHEVRSIWQFDDVFTAPLFGFGTAANYYATQSALQFLKLIRVPTLIITAQDDPLVPFSMYHDPVFQTNPALTLLAPAHGGHLGFLSRGRPRFWLDEAALPWIQLQTALIAMAGTNLGPVASGSKTH